MVSKLDSMKWTVMYLSWLWLHLTKLGVSYL